METTRVTFRPSEVRLGDAALVGGAREAAFPAEEEDDATEERTFSSSPSLVKLLSPSLLSLLNTPLRLLEPFSIPPSFARVSQGRRGPTQSTGEDATTAGARDGTSDDDITSRARR